MSKRLTDKFLHDQIDRVLRGTGQSRKPKAVNLHQICEWLGVTVEWRKMIPEGAVVVETGGLRIYLQDNFRDNPRVARRQRFTWAHEICHTLFFQLDKSPPIPSPGTPKGAILESMCQRGAGHLLLPLAALEDLFGVGKGLEHIDQLRETAEQFEVSPEVVLRRLSESPDMFAAHCGFLGISRATADGTRESIRYYCGGNWVSAEIPAPRVGQLLDEWMATLNRTLQPIEKDRWRSRSEEVEISLTRVGRNAPVLQLSAHLIERNP